MDIESFRPYPIKNKYEFYLPEVNTFDSIGRYNLMDIHIYTLSDDISDGVSHDHRFNTFHCNNITNDEIAWVTGLELISLFRGLCTIFMGEETQRHIRIVKMKSETDPRVNFPNYNSGFDYLIKPDFYKELGKNIFFNLSFNERKNYIENAKKNVFNSSLYLAQENLGLYTLLKYFSEPLTWANLYKIMETLENLQKSSDQGWTIPYNKIQREKFSNPANNFGAIGTEARHGFAILKKPNNSPKMDIREAKTMFIESAQSYLNFKLEEFRATL